MIISRLSGGMGNQMFQYAVGRKLSLQYDVPLKLDTTFLLQRVTFPALLRPDFAFRNYDLDVFAIAATIATANDMKWWQRPILSGKAMLFIDAVLRKMPVLKGWEKSFTFDERVLKLGPNAYLAGFWQSPKYFESIRNVLLEDFRLVHPLPEHSQRLVQEIDSKESLCMFIRRADIASKKFHGAVDVEYYTRAVNHLAARKNIEKVYIFSDDIAWCKEHISVPFDTMFVDNQYAGKKWEDHMALMQHCKHFIISNSTFAWWPAWLAAYPDKIVVAPKQWFNGNIDTKDLIPPEWVRV
jgi:hypothetical protein